VSDTCPADAHATSGTVCRAAAGVCDVAETCDGTSAACPADMKSTAVCRPSAGVCDVAESCDGAANDCPPNGFAANTTECRAAAGVCDLAEHCTGTSTACPSDAKSTAVCRAAAGVCDVAESCDGVSDACPSDAFQPATVVCRAAAGQCDQAESCTGSGAACPADDPLPDGTSCNDGAACTTPDVCVAGTCQGNAQICGDGTVQTGCGENCDDGNTTDGDGCSSSCQLESTPGCGAAPATGCRPPIQTRAASVLIRINENAAKDALQWKWNRGTATPKPDYGFPTATTNYQLCIYAASSLVRSVPLPAAGICGNKRCWTENSSGFKYADKYGTHGGITRIVLKGGEDPGKPKIQVKAKGANVAPPALPIAQPVTVQLRNSDGICWEAVYGAPASHNDAAQFRDKSD
jgi:cysteine-rich repeat protein